MAGSGDERPAARQSAPVGVRPQEERSDGTERTRRALSVSSTKPAMFEQEVVSSFVLAI